MPRCRTSSAPELLVPLDRTSPSRSIDSSNSICATRSGSGRFAAESTLPSTRALAGQLGVVRGIVVEAYEQLIAEGYLASRPGGSTRVAPNADRRPAPADASQRAAVRVRLPARPAGPDRVPARRLAALAPPRAQRDAGGAARLHRRPRHARAARGARDYLNRARGTGAPPRSRRHRDRLLPRPCSCSPGAALRGARAGSRIEDPWHPSTGRWSWSRSGCEVVDDPGRRPRHPRRRARCAPTSTPSS